MRSGRAAAAFVLGLVAAGASAESEKISPFQAVRWRAGTPVVLFQGGWYELVSLDGMTTSAILKFCRRTYGEKWRKRFLEDLGRVLHDLKRPPAATTNLVLRPAAGGEPVRFEGVPMTTALRQRVKRTGGDQPFVPVRRAHAGSAPPELAPLRRRIPPDEGEDSFLLEAAHAAADLDELEGLLESVWSCRGRREVDHRALLDAVRSGLGDEIDLWTFALQIQKVLARLGDGHAGVRDLRLSRFARRRYTPFLIGEEGGRMFAFREDRSALWDEEHPFLRSMDGVAIERWLEAAARTVADGSPQYRRTHARRNLRYVGYLRLELGLPDARTISVELESEDREQVRRTDVPLKRRRRLYRVWPRTRSRVLEGRLGYLRIEEMRAEPGFLDELRVQMDSFRKTKGLVVDVRGNGGGSRLALLALFPYLMKRSDPPRVGNVAAYRLPPGESENDQGHLESRYAYPAAARRWKSRDRSAILRFLRGFRPEWTPPPDRFTRWHALLLHPQHGGYTILNPRLGRRVEVDFGKRYPYDRPVVVLMDSWCFSATDVFLGAFKGWRNVTLLGLPSGGGSGRGRSWSLARSGLRVRLSSMASFQPDGLL
ncbi:MAG: S41 family peptidase, partial [Planctomycetota bacterium]